MQKLSQAILLLVLVLLISSFNNPFAEKVKLDWISLQQAQVKLKANKKPILIDLYTDWCGWCKVMDKKTYSNAQVAKYINENFYPVKLDAETKETLLWNGKSFNYNSQVRVNDFALALTQGQLSFPTTVILPPDGSTPQAIPGYLEVKDMEMLVKYFGDGHYGKTPFMDYQKKFVSVWK
jgi:thioredoxin-related protein